MSERDGTSEDTKKFLFILDATTIVRLSQKKRVLIFQTLTEIQLLVKIPNVGGFL